jgi:hypothetical protein
VLELLELPLTERVRADEQRARPRAREPVPELALPAPAGRQVPDVEKRPQPVAPQLLGDPLDHRLVERVVRQEDIELRAAGIAAAVASELPRR